MPCNMTSGGEQLNNIAYGKLYAYFSNNGIISVILSPDLKTHNSSSTKTNEIQ